MNWLSLIQSGVSDFDSFLKGSSWMGRENEVVNLFAHRFLPDVISPNSPLRSLRQIGIEVAVRQVGNTGKKYVRKDLVIWPEEDMTVWSGSGVPAVIVEWKIDAFKKCQLDVVWLEKYCEQNPGVLGISICAHVRNSKRGYQIVYVAGSHCSN